MIFSFRIPFNYFLLLYPIEKFDYNNLYHDNLLEFINLYIPIISSTPSVEFNDMGLLHLGFFLLIAIYIFPIFLDVENM